MAHFKKTLPNMQHELSHIMFLFEDIKAHARDQTQSGAKRQRASCVNL